ncbi:hypothetical protein SSX86_000220 [Deinandra increscens subsp. villosa]|uniref:NB-ARC domain-containing protein n=1 Tax=Deinandra increscens subsp. villosa TaxID=3103831 RepID=A0AAP0DXI4_9ASTR
MTYFAGIQMFMEKLNQLINFNHVPLINNPALFIHSLPAEIVVINDLKKSRILLTTRLTEVAKNANSNGLIHHLGYLNEGKSWELLRTKVFHDINECPEWSIRPGMQIVESCKGLPLSVAVIAGVLAKDAWNRKWWEEIAETTRSYIVGEENGCLEILALSYHHLPLHLRECFLYLGGFPEDHKFHVKRLIWLWVAEGFIQQDGSGSLEDTAGSYLKGLIDRNLVSVSHISKFNGAVKRCILHDLVRELCLRKAKEERLIWSSPLSNAITPPYKPVRIFITPPYKQGTPPQSLRSIWFFSAKETLSDDIARMCFCPYMLLRVLVLQSSGFNGFPTGME